MEELTPPIPSFLPGTNAVEAFANGFFMTLLLLPRFLSHMMINFAPFLMFSL
jgi:hypothetical protein